ncbi:MAG: FMN-binding protein, partial [Gordonibacter sp.]
KMASIEVLEQNETADIGEKALEKLPQAVLDAQSVEVDAVSGATVTSKAFFAAVTEAVAKAS